MAQKKSVSKFSRPVLNHRDTSNIQFKGIPENLSGHLQDNIVTLLVMSEKYCKEVMGLVKPELYSNIVIRDIVENAHEFIGKHGKPPGQHIADMLEKKLQNEDEGDLYREALSNINTLWMDKFNEEYVRGTLLHFTKLQRLKRAVTGLIESAESGDADSADLLIEKYRQANEASEATGNTFITLAEFLALKLPDLPKLCGDWLRKKGIVEVVGEPEAGKTLFMQVVMWCLASGVDVPGLKWKVERPCRVVYYDSEMPGEDMQERWNSIWYTLRRNYAVGMQNLRFLNQDLFVDQEGNPVVMPNLAEPEGQAWFIARCLEHEAEVVVIDNQSTSFQTEEGENSDLHWDRINALLSRLRALGMAVILLHHPGKDLKRGGSGHSKQRRLLSIEISLEKVLDAEPKAEPKGLHVNVVFKKWRGVPSEQKRTRTWRVEDVPPRLRFSSGSAVGVEKDDSQAKRQKARELQAAGKSYQDIAKVLRISKTTVSRWMQKS